MPGTRKFAELQRWADAVVHLDLCAEQADKLAIDALMRMDFKMHRLGQIEANGYRLAAYELRHAAGLDHDQCVRCTRKVAAGKTGNSDE